MDRELSFRDFLAIILKKSVGIIAITIIIAIIVGAFGVYGAYRHNLSVDTLANSDDFKSELDSIQSDCTHFENQLKSMEQYMSQSMYFSLDGYNCGMCDIHFTVSGFRGNVTSKMLLEAYATLYESNFDMIDAVKLILIEAANPVTPAPIDSSIPESAAPTAEPTPKVTPTAEQLEEIDDKYVCELISITPAFDDSAALIRVLHSDSSVAQEIAECVYSKMHDYVSENIGKHNVDRINVYSRYQVNQTVIKYQSDYYASFNEMEDNLETAQNQYEVTSNMTNKRSYVSSAVKYAVIGAFAGFVVSICVLIIIEMLKGKLLSAGEAFSRYSIEVITVVPSKKRRLFNKKIEKLEGSDGKTHDEAIKFAAASVNALCESDNILFVSTLGCDVVKDEMENCKSLLNANAVMCGNILTDANAVQSLKSASAVVIFERIGKTSLTKLDDTIRRLNIADKKIIGIILV